MLLSLIVLISARLKLTILKKTVVAMKTQKVTFSLTSQ